MMGKFMQRSRPPAVRKAAALLLALALGGTGSAFGAWVDWVEGGKLKIGPNGSPSVGLHALAAIGAGAEAIGVNAIAMGQSSYAKGQNSFALGLVARAEGNSSYAIGTNTKATNEGSIAIGREAESTGEISVALGFKTVAKGGYATAMGNETSAEGESSTAMGSKSKAIGNVSTAMGVESEAKGGSSVAMGYKAQTAGYASIAMGNVTRATGAASTAMGSNTLAEGNYSTAMGSSSQAKAINSLAASGGIVETAAVNSFAVGVGARAVRADSVALGSGAMADTAAGKAAFLGAGQSGAAWISTRNAVAVGNLAGNITRQITGVAAGTDNDDAVNVAQLKRAATWTIKDSQTPTPGSKVIDVSTPLVVKGDAYIKPVVNAAGLNFTLDQTKLNSQINAQVNTNPTVTGHTTDINALKGGFTVSNAAGTKQTITLGGATKKNIQFVGEANKILVEVASAADGATVTVKTDPNLGTHLNIANNGAITSLNTTVNGHTTDITALKAGFNVKSGSSVGPIVAGDTLEFAGINYIQTSYDAAAKKLTVGLDTTALNSQINNQVNSNTTVTQHGTDITALKNGFTVSNAAGTKQDITLGGATKKNIKFEGETDKIDVTVAADGADGAKVTVTANANLGTNLDISNNATVTNLSNTVSGNTANIATNTSNITKLQGGFDLKAGSTTNNVALGGATAPTVEFAGADDTVTVDLTGTKVTYGIDKTKLITQLNNNSTTITNVEAKFKLADEGTGTTTVTADKTGTQTVKFAGDGNIIESEVGTAGVKYSLNTTALNTAITNN
ncbi:hypothetical protein, partial [Pyramidobacter sp. C12-8]|uniref:hypothetical protein n=1 Tax=Pyramidobacter sp. C12-8 TaxID=1943580 RepID=UPI0009D40D9E